MRFLKDLGWGIGLGEPEEMERKREKTTNEWGRGRSNSWMEKVNTTAGGDWGHQREGEEGHHLGVQEQVLAPSNPQVQRAECGSGGGGEAGGGHIRPRPSFPSLRGPKLFLLLPSLPPGR